MHIELTEMLRCPEPHELAFLVLSTGEMVGRSIRSGIVGCPLCRREYRIANGIVDFGGSGRGEGGRFPLPQPETLQAVLDLSGPGGLVVLLGNAARSAPALAALMGGIHFVGVNPPKDVEELPMLSVLRAAAVIPLRPSVARGVVVGADTLSAPWIAEAAAVLLRGRRYVVESESFAPPPSITRLASGGGLWVGEKQ
ncbi:MAG TPA: hypothetical protein VLV45_14670 [Gemmatimonadales bacterium]|nr:hypothetical protein [Gemmatimonadales bacterium]